MSATALVRRPVSRAARELSLPRVDAAAARVWVCAGATLTITLLWSARDGGYDTTSWLEGGMALVIVAAWARFVLGRGSALGRSGRIALAALGLYVTWSYTSVLWAGDKGTALTGSHRALLYLVVFGLFAGLAWTTRRLELALLVYLLGLGALAVGVLAELATSPARQLLQEGQLAAGLGYHNATAALGTIGALGSILVGSSRRRSPLIRAALAAGAAACLELSLLAESRGWLYTLPVVVVLTVALAPRRGRTAAWGLVPALAVAATVPWVAHGPGETSARVALAAALASAAAAFAAARLGRRYVLSAQGRRLAHKAARVLAAVTAATAIGGGALLIASGAAARGWHQFTTNAPVHAGVQRFGELGSGRYDFWRVALRGFAAHPLGGLGQDNFAQPYVAARHTGQEPAWIHSLELRLLAHTGLVGFALFAIFTVFALGSARLALRASDRRARLAVAAALVPLTVWLVHGSVDWFWEIPALSVPAFAFLGAAVALEPGRERKATAPVAVWLVGAAAALLLFGSAYVGERALQDGRALAASKPAAALHKLSLAAQLEPLSSAPQALQAGIALRTGHAVSALRFATAGIRRDSGDWVLWLEDGLAAGAAGRPGVERAALERARALDPREPVIALAQRRAATPNPLTIAEAQSMLSARAQATVAP
jgi:hypothetical protein